MISILVFLLSAVQSHASISTPVTKQIPAPSTTAIEAKSDDAKSEAPALQSESAPTQSSQIHAKEPTLAPKRYSYDRKYGLTLGIEFPTGPALEFNYRYDRMTSFGLSVGGIYLGGLLLDSGSQQKGVTNSLSTFAVEAKARWHVSERAFFLGMAAGWQSFYLSGIDANPFCTAYFSRFYLSPHLGWMWVLDSGFTIGTEFGIQVLLGAPYISQNQLSANSLKTLNDVSHASIYPYLTFIKAGYSF